MQGRPPSSRSRPTTSARPLTARDRDYAAHGNPMAHPPAPYEIEEEYDDESDDEDVFAFLPPTTADQEQQRQLAEQQQQQQAQPTTTSPYAPGGAGTAAAAAASLQAQYYPQHHPQQQHQHQSPFSHSPFAHEPAPASHLSHPHPSQPPTHFQTNNPYAVPQYPDATFDPWGRYAGAGAGVGAPATPGAESGMSSPAQPDPSSASTLPSALSAPVNAPTPAPAYDNTNPNDDCLASNININSTNPYFALAASSSASFPAAPSLSATAAPQSPGRQPIVSPPGGSTNYSHPTSHSQSHSQSQSHPPPRSQHPNVLPPPSPSTDSQPSTGYGYPHSQAMPQGQDNFKLRRLGAGAGASERRSADRERERAPGVGVVAVVDEGYREDNGGRGSIEERERQTQAQRKEREVRPVRVNLPTLTGVEVKERRRTSNGTEADADLEESDTAASEKDLPLALAKDKDLDDGGRSPVSVVSGVDPTLNEPTLNEHANSPTGQVHGGAGGRGGGGGGGGGGGKKKRGSKRGSGTPGTGPSNTGNGTRTPRRRNPNAQPYYAYAAYASAYGYPTRGGTSTSTHRPASASAHASASPSAPPTSAPPTSASHLTANYPPPTPDGVSHSHHQHHPYNAHNRSGSYISPGTAKRVDSASLADTLSLEDRYADEGRYGYADDNDPYDGRYGERYGYGYGGDRVSYSRRRRGGGDEEGGYGGESDGREGYGDGGRSGEGEGDGDGVSEEGSEEGSIKMEFDFDAIEEEDSPFPEVRASVSNIDDPDMPAMTIRMWFVGLLLCMTSSALNVFFNFRSPAPTVVPLVLLLISYPFGKFLAFTLPITTYRIPLPHLPRGMFPVHQPSFAPFRLIVNLLLPLTYSRALEFSLNPGPWNIKEHVLVYIMANVAVGNPYALNAIVVSEVFYDIVLGYWFSLTLVLATQLTGFGLAGLCRRFLVWPASMVWPQNLVACTLLNTLHAEDEDDGIGMYGGTAEPGAKGMSRYRFFVICTFGSFFWFFLPGYLFSALSVFSFICWAAPTNVPVNQLFGVRTGLGMSVLTFDWSQITWIGSPLMVPWWAEVHIFFGFVLFYWILVPILYYTNSWQLAYFPISANEPFDRFGESYNITRVLKPDDRFDPEAYHAYSPLYLPATYAMTYLLAFALSTCVIVHTLLYHGRTLINGLKRIRIEADDIHAKLMRNYPEVPDWWYAIGFCVFFSLAIIAVEVWDTGVPVYALLLAVLLPVIYILPSGFIYAMTGQGITLNLLAQIIPGTLLPGQPLANMVFKAYAVQTLSAATSFVQDLKLGHYVKVPPRATFLVQMVATALAAFIQVGVKQWIFDNVPDICQKNQPSSLTCPHNQVFFTASAVWGLIGPTRQFGTGSLYHPHLYAIVVGTVLPVPFFLYQRKYPKSWVRYVSTPVILNGVSSIPPATGINYSSWFAVGFVFQYLIRKRNFAWWSKFNYVLSSALDSGTVISVIVIFFTLQFPNGIPELNWWGNSVYVNTADYQRTPLKTIPEGGLPWTALIPTATPLPPPPS